jgi:hypothetical protein
MNLYLYIPPASAHLPNMLNGLIYGRLQSYKHTNSNAKDYVHFAIPLAKRLIARRWNQETITKLMDEAHCLLDMKPQHFNDTKPIPQLQPLIFPLPFHLWGLQQQTIQDIYKKTLGRHIPDQSQLWMSLGLELARTYIINETA